jgi:hypothetical protein
MVEQFREALAAWCSEIVVDASRVYWVSPFTACWIAALKDSVEAINKNFLVIEPTRDNALHQWVNLGISLYIGSKEGETAYRALPVFLVRKLTESSYPLAGQVTHILADRLKGAENFHKALHFGIREVIDNSFEHGRVSDCYIAAYAVPSKNVVRLCIFDCGVGVSSSLRENRQFREEKDDLVLLERSLDRGVSGKSAGRGIGLYLLRDTVEKNAGASLAILSEKGLVEVTEKGIKRTPLSRRFGGTIVKLRLRTKERFKFVSISDWDSL